MCKKVSQLCLSLLHELLQNFSKKGGDFTALKPLKIPGKSKKKSAKKTAKTQPHNVKKLTEAEHKKVIDFNNARKAAEKRYGGKNPAKIRDEKMSKTVEIGDVSLVLEVSAVPDVKTYATEAGVPRKGAKTEVKHAAKTGEWRKKNH